MILSDPQSPSSAPCMFRSTFNKYMQPQPAAKDTRRKRGRVFFKPLNLLSCNYLYLHIIALRWRISSVQTALAQWITHPKMCRSTPYYISDCVTSTSVIAISDKLIHVFYFVCRYLQVYQTFTIHFFPFHLLLFLQNESSI